MNGEEFRAALHGGRRVYGTAVTSASSVLVRTIQQIGLDWVFIDNEHSPIGREQTAWLCQAYQAAGVVPVVRIPTAEAHYATMALDAGAQAVIIPYMEDPDVVREMVGAVKLRPLKGHLLEGMLRGEPGLGRTADYLAHRNRGNSLIINVESVPALERLDELCSVDGLDAVLIGPHDLTVSLDIPEQYEHPRFIEAALRILRTARAHGIGAGIHSWTTLDQELFFLRESGANLVAHSVDVLFAMQALRQELGWLRRELGEQVAEPAAANEAV